MQPSSSKRGETLVIASKAKQSMLVFPKLCRAFGDGLLRFARNDDKVAAGNFE